MAVSPENSCGSSVCLQDKPTDNMKNSSKSVRCNCTALIRLLRSADKGWYVARHGETHNHALSKACSDKLTWSSHKHIGKYTRDLAYELDRPEQMNCCFFLSKKLLLVRNI